jgi:hypothetical protein
MIKLNKNQRKFFEEAIRHFNDKANDVLRKELVEFANDQGLILPTSALKKICTTDIRGHYDLTKTGIVAENIIDEMPVEPKKEELPKSFKSSPDVIIDTPVYAEQKEPIIENKRPTKAPVSTKPVNQKKDMVYCLFDDDMQLISVHKSISGAYTWCKKFNFHSHIKNISVQEAEKKVVDAGNCVLYDSNSGLNAYIIAQKIRN